MTVHPSAKKARQSILHGSLACLALLTLGATSASAQVVPEAGYEKGFYIRSAAAPFTLKIQSRVQSRLAMEVAEDEKPMAAFSIPRARLKLSGNAYSKETKFAFQMDFGKGFASLKDFYVDQKLPVGGLHLRLGQYKRPFSRQQLTSSGKQEFVDRAITDKAFGAGRDIGLAIHNGYGKSGGLEFALGVFNGTGDKTHLSGDVSVDTTTGEGSIDSGKFSNVPSQFLPALVLRVAYNHGEFSGYDEVDFKGGGLRFAVGAGWIGDLNAAGSDSAGMRANLDAIVKIAGLAVNGALYQSWSQDGDRFADQQALARGGHVQAGYLIAGRYQPSLRYAQVSSIGGDVQNHELMAGFSIYLHKHGLKWQTDGGALTTVIDGGVEQSQEILVRTQLQLAF